MGNTLKSIPLSKLNTSKLNVRKTDRTADIEQLAASIAANGLLENLVVQADPACSNGDARYEVIAGGRRFAALKLLAKRKTIDRDLRIPCLVLKEGALQASLAENFVRLQLHPADQFEAFAGLAGQGLPPDEIGARFGVTPVFVEQRLKLAAVSPRLIAEYRKGAMTLEQLTAFTLSDDQKAQDDVWFESPYADIPAQMIRRLLTKAQVDGQDRRARFIGAKAYEAAGGSILRDLFDAEDEGYFSDSQLLDRLVAEKLEAKAEEVRAEGWSWVEVHSETGYAFLSGFGRAETVEVTLSQKEERKLAKLAAQYDELVADLEETDETASTALDKVSAELAALQAKKVVWPDDAKAGAGAIVALGPDATIEVVRGLVKPDPVAERSVTAQRKKDRKADNGYSDAVLLELSTQRTAALREAVAASSGVAFLALLQALVGQLLYDGASDSCIQIGGTEVLLDRASATIGDSKAGQAFQARHAAWLERLPEREGLWSWLESLDAMDRAALLAHCVALTVNSLSTPSVSEARRKDSDRLAAVIKLDMRDWWKANATFLKRLTKDEILATVTEGVSAQAARDLTGLKKDAMAAKAADKLSEKGWLPKPLRPTVTSEAGGVVL